MFSQAELDEANEALKHLRQDKIAETDGLSGLEQELATLRSVLQAKEEQLTQTTDKLLQVSNLDTYNYVQPCLFWFYTLYVKCVWA